MAVTLLRKEQVLDSDFATQSELDLKANTESPTFTGTVSGITPEMVGLGGLTDTMASIKAVTDLLPDAGALTSIATAAQIVAIDGLIDSIKSKTDAIKNNPTTVYAHKISAPIGTGETTCVALSDADGFSCQSMEIQRITVVCNGNSSNFNVSIYQLSTLVGSSLLEIVGCSSPNGLDLALPGILYINRDLVPSHSIYFKFENIADDVLGTTTFDVYVTGKLCEDPT